MEVVEIMRKGIILAGGLGSRLYPMTVSISKQLLPIYDKPMIYYPLTVLMLSGIREILIITTPEDKNQFERLLGNGRQWGISIQYKIQYRPEGIAQALILAEEFLNHSPSILILGDNIFFGHGLPQILISARNQRKGATVFGYHVKDPERYGVIGYDNAGKVISIVEKPLKPPSNYALTGLYFFDNSASERAKKVTPSDRRELEITTLLEQYLDDGILDVKYFGRGIAWLDTGTPKSLLEASNFVMTLIERQGLQVGSPEEIAFKMGWIEERQLDTLIADKKDGSYKSFLQKLKLKEP